MRGNEREKETCLLSPDPLKTELRILLVGRRRTVAEEPVKIEKPPFLDVLFNAIEIARIAYSQNGIRSRILCASSIIESAFSIEALANSLLHKIAFRHFKELERLQAFPKFEVFARSRNRTIDFGKNEYACALELIRLRNEYVHPKVSNIDMKLAKSVGALDEFSGVPIHGEAEYWEEPKGYTNLGIPSENWSPADATIVVAKLLKFVDRLVIDDCGMTGAEIKNHLLPHARHDGKLYQLTPTYLDDQNGWLQTEAKTKSRLIQAIMEIAKSHKLKLGTHRK